MPKNYQEQHDIMQGLMSKREAALSSGQDSAQIDAAIRSLALDMTGGQEKPQADQTVATILNAIKDHIEQGIKVQLEGVAAIEGKQGPQGPEGPRGHNYVLTDQDVRDIALKVRSLIPLGTKMFTPAEMKQLVKEIALLVPAGEQGPKGDSIKGEPGAPGKDAVVDYELLKQYCKECMDTMMPDPEPELTSEQIVEKVRNAPKGKKIKYSDIEDTPDIKAIVRSMMTETTKPTSKVARTAFLYELDDVDFNTTKPSNNQVLGYDASKKKWRPQNAADIAATWGNISGTITDQADLIAYIAAHSATPAGSNGSLQYNDSGALGGFGNWNGTVLNIDGKLELHGTGTFYSLDMVNDGGGQVDIRWIAPATTGTGYNWMFGTAATVDNHNDFFIWDLLNNRPAMFVNGDTGNMLLGGNYDFYLDNGAVLQIYDNNGNSVAIDIGNGNAKMNLDGSASFAGDVTQIYPDGSIRVYGNSSYSGQYDGEALLLFAQDTSNVQIAQLLGNNGIGAAFYGTGAMGTDGPVFQATNYHVTNTVPFYWQPFGGNIVIGGTTDNGNMLQVAGSASFDGEVKTQTLNISSLPTSPSGLASGDVWVDTTGGLNVLKVV